MSDGDNSDFLDDPKAYEDEQSDVFSGLSRRGSESYNQPPEELNLRKQDSGAKNPNMVVDLKTRLRKNTSESSEPMRTYQDIPVPPPPMYNPPIMHQMPPQQAIEHSGKPVVEIGMRLKSIYPQRYFIFKNMKPQHFKFCKENNYGITQKTNENTLKSAFENSENLLIIFSNTEQRSFLGYARMESDYFDAPEMIDNFTKNSGLTRVDFDNNFIFRIEWKSKNTVRYEFVSHIKNKYNENREVNHSKVFQEVDPSAGKALIALLENPPTEPISEHEPPEHKRDEQPPIPFHKAPKQEGNFPPNNFMMNNPMMPPHFGYYPMGPMNPMGGQMGGMGMGPIPGQPGMFPMPGQPGMMGGMPKQFPYNMNYNDYYMNMQQQQQQQQQQMMKQNKDKGRKKSASSSGSSSRSSSGSSRSSSPKKGSVKGGRRDSKSASRSRSKSHKRQNKMEKRGGNNNYQKDYQKGGRKYDHNNPNPNYQNQNRNKFQKFDKFDKNNNNYNKNNNYRGGNNNPHNRRRNSRSGSPNNRNPKNRFNNNNNNNNNNNRSQRRSHSRSEEDRRRHTPEDQNKEENFESQQQQQPERETHQETQSPVIQRERSLSNHNDLEDPFDFGDMEDRISEGGNDRKVEEERQESPHAFDEDIRPGKRRSNSRSNKRSGSASSSKSVTESKSTTTKNQDIDFRTDIERKKKFSREDAPLVITKGNNKIIGGKGNTERLIIGKPNKYSKGRSPDRSERYERHDRHDRYDRHRNDRNDRRRSSRERDNKDNRDNRDHRNSSSRKSRERDASRDRKDANRDRKEMQRERRDEKRDEPKERRDEGYDSKPKETPRRDREPERSVESSETKGKRIDLRERLTQKDALAAGSITNRIIKKN